MPSRAGWPEPGPPGDGRMAQTRRSGGRHRTEDVSVGRLARRFTESSIIRIWRRCAWYCVLGVSFRVTHRGVRVTPGVGPGLPLRLGARWVSESNLRGPQGLTSCGRLNASPSEARSRAGAWAVRVAPGRAQLPPRGQDPDREEVAADVVC